jgi:hypothetical protein
MLDQIRQLGEQFGFLRVFMGVLAGTTKKNDLQKWLLKQMNEDERPQDRKKYEDLEGEDKEGFDAIVATVTELQGVFDEAVKAKAGMCFKFYKALQEAGFDKNEAIAIVAAQGADIMKTSSQ